jgi:hypothetical protein
MIVQRPALVAGVDDGLGDALRALEPVADRGGRDALLQVLGRDDDERRYAVDADALGDRGVAGDPGSGDDEDRRVAEAGEAVGGWRDVWPGGAFVTVAAGIANWAFPFYLSNVSSLSRFGSTLGFILIALLWFYLLSLALLVGATINSLRHELHDTGELPYRSVN